MRELRQDHKQQVETGSSHADEPIIRSLAAAGRPHSDLAAALAEIAALFRAASNSIAADAAELAAKSFATTIEARTGHDGSLGRRDRDQCRIAGTNFSRAPQALVCRRRK